MISLYLGGISLFLSKSPYLEFQNFPIYVYLIHLPIWNFRSISNQEIPSLFNHSPYFERQISLFCFPGGSHICLLVKRQTDNTTPSSSRLNKGKPPISRRDIFWRCLLTTGCNQKNSLLTTSCHVSPINQWYSDNYHSYSYCVVISSSI